MSLEKLDTEVRREQIAQAALALIASQGMNGLNMTGLARRVGLVPSAIYRHFKNKDELVGAALDLLQKRLLGNVRAAIEKAEGPLEQLKRLLVLHLTLILEYQALPRILFSEEVHSGHPERKAKVRAVVMTYLEEIGAIVRRGQQEKCIRPELNAGTVSLMFLGLVQPAAILWYLSDGAFDVAKHVERAWPIFQEVIRARN